MNSYHFETIDFHLLVESLSRAIEMKDIYTAGHSDRVARISQKIAEVQGKDKDFCTFVHLAGHLHDIGKMGIPDGILLKTGKLSNQEYAVIQLHSLYGYRILKDIPQLEVMAQTILHHHERQDGRGYPAGLKGHEIPAGSAIIAVADAFDAMTTTRSYRKSISPGKAIDELVRNKEIQFNPEVVEAIVKIYQDDPAFLSQFVINEQQILGNPQYKPFNSIS